MSALTDAWMTVRSASKKEQDSAAMLASAQISAETGNLVALAISGATSVHNADVASLDSALQILVTRFAGS